MALDAPPLGVVPWQPGLKCSMRNGTEMQLTSQQISLYFSQPEKITDPDLLQRYTALLTDAELAQMSRFYFAGHRHQYLLTRALIRTCLSAYYPVEPADWRFAKNDYGKPLVSHPQSGVNASFNLSHTQGLIVCAITGDVDIGVDVEDANRTTRTAFESLSSYFSEQEIADLGALPADQQKQRFFDYWTLKESYIKARGLGLAIPLGKFSFHFKDNQLEEFRVQPELGDDACNWRFWRIAMTERYPVAVAVNSAKPDFEIKAYDAVPLLRNDPIDLIFK
jgi:4'-phosphopantetheinyl transferase